MHHGFRRAERVRGGTSARGAAPTGAGRTRGRVGGRRLPRAGRRPGLGAAHLAAVPAQEMGRRAVELLLGRLDGRESGDVVLIAPELTVRASSGPAPTAP
ncbi:hypothetical protein GPN2_20099 [Streptomyces murinus]